MNVFRNLFDALRPRFEEGGRFHKLYAFYESIETVFFGPVERTQGLPHVRDSLDVKRFMMLVIVALIPHLCFGMYQCRLPVAACFGAVHRFFTGGLERDLARVAHGDRHLRRGVCLGNSFCGCPQARNQRGPVRVLHAVPADAPARNPVVAGGPGDFLRHRDRQGGLWRHRAQFSEPGPDRSRLFVFRLPGQPFRRSGLDRAQRRA